MILLIDNYDSFVHNLARYFRQLGQETRVVRNDAITVAEIRETNPLAVVLSPGPCAPQQAGICLELVRQLHEKLAILGICLGHQVIAEAFGGKVMRAKEPVHGRASFIHHHGTAAFAGMSSPLRVGRYHSLIVDELPKCLRIDATLADGTPMAISHVNYPVFGWQFHPESVLTSHGYELLTAFLHAAGAVIDLAKPAVEDAVKLEKMSQPDWFRTAIRYPQANPDDGEG